MPFEVVKRDSRPGLVVLVECRQLADGNGPRPQVLDHLGSGGERRPLPLVRERDGDVGPDDPGQRLDRILLDRGQIVEPIEEDGGRMPAARLCPKRVERAPGKALGVGPPKADRAETADCVESVESLEVGAI